MLLQIGAVQCETAALFRRTACHAKWIHWKTVILIITLIQQHRREFNSAPGHHARQRSLDLSRFFIGNPPTVFDRVEKWEGLVLDLADRKQRRRARREP